MSYTAAMRAMMRVPIVCLTLFALSIVGYGMRWYSLVVVMMALVAIVLAFPAWSASITTRLWRCAHCDVPLPTSFRYGLVMPLEVTTCPACQLRVQ